MTAKRASEGQRVLRNVAAIGAFAMSPVQMFLLVRALGTDGYGRWWWTFVILEVAQVLGMIGAELYVRREIPRIDRENGGDDEVVAVIGSALAVAGGAGLLLAGAQVALAKTIASAQADPELSLYLVVMAAQPLLLNLAAVLGAALQSRDVLLPIAVLRGIIMPVAQAAALLVAWRCGASTQTTLLLMLAIPALGLAGVTILYAQRLSLAHTLAQIARPRHAADAFRYGAVLFVPVVLFAIANKLDLYVLGAYAGATTVGIYAACIQFASAASNVRALFDPVIQTQVAALHGADNRELAASLRRLARLCAFAIAPAFVLTISVGEPIVSFLIGRPVPDILPALGVLTAGNVLAGIAVASWLVPMMMPGRALVGVAVVTLCVKIALLALLVPEWGPLGAAIGAGTASFIALAGQAIVGGTQLGERPYSADVLPLLAVMGVLGATGRLLYTQLAPDLGWLAATCIAGAASVGVLVIIQLRLLTRDERASLVRLVRGAA